MCSHIYSDAEINTKIAAGALFNIFYLAGFI